MFEHIDLVVRPKQSCQLVCNLAPGVNGGPPEWRVWLEVDGGRWYRSGKDLFSVLYELEELCFGYYNQ